MVEEQKFGESTPLTRQENIYNTTKKLNAQRSTGRKSLIPSGKKQFHMRSSKKILKIPMKEDEETEVPEGDECQLRRSPNVSAASSRQGSVSNAGSTYGGNPEMREQASGQKNINVTNYLKNSSQVSAIGLTNSTYVKNHVITYNPTGPCHSSKNTPKSKPKNHNFGP